MEGSSNDKDMPYIDHFKSKSKNTSRPSSVLKPTKTLKFYTMVGREEGDTFSQSPNIVIGNRALRGLDPHEERFALPRDEPTISTKVKNDRVTSWKWQDAEKDKTMDFFSKSYCNNIYKPGIDIKYNKIDTGCKFTSLSFLPTTLYRC